MSGFQHDIAGGGGNLVIASVQSPGYVPGTSGWQVRIDGSAEFNNLTIRGTFQGTSFVISASGVFFYSPSEGPGNLIASVAPGSGSDPYGNAYIAGITSYAGSTSASANGGQMQLSSGSPFQPAQLGAGGAGNSFLSSGLAVSGDIGAEIILESQDSAGQATINLSAALVQALNAMTVDGNLTVNGNLILAVPLAVSGTCSAAGLPDGTIHGTSGGASAGTAHTHGPGSFAVGNGVHSHGAGSYQA